MKKQRFLLSILLIVIPAMSSCMVTGSSGGDRATPFSVIRTPNGGLVPEVSLDKKGILHMTYGKDSDGYYVQSPDGGKTFTPPVQLNRRAGTVTVGGERGPKIAIGKDGYLYVAFRTGYQNIRDFYLLKGRKTENNFRLVPVSADNWELEACPMSGPSFTVEDNGQVLISWMSRDRVYWSISNSEASTFAPRVATPQGGEGEYHPIVLTNHKGQVLLVWKEGPQANWAIYTMDGKFTGERGNAGVLNGRSKPEAFLGTDGNFNLVL